MSKKRWTSRDAGMFDTSKKPATPQQRMQALGRLKDGEMNNTERAYAALLESRKMAGEVLWWAFEPVNIKLAKATFYRVDFLVMLADRSLEAHEVKGYWTDDARVKIKVAAEKMPILKFVAIQRIKGEWVYEHF